MDLKHGEEQQDTESFLHNLWKIYAVYLGGFVMVVLFIAILEAAGVADRTLGYLYTAFTIIVYAAIGIMSRTQGVGGASNYA